MALNALRTALGCLGFTNAAAVFITDLQGLDSLDEFRPLMDDKVENLIKVTHHPGGTIPNPPPVVACAPALPLIPNPGIPVFLHAENNLQLMCYLLRHMEQTSRTITSQTITVTQVHTLCDHQCWEQDHEDLEPLELNSKDWPRTIESINEWLKGCLGVSKIPLAYMICEKEVPDQANDLPGNYTMIQEELIMWAPVRTANGAYTPTFLDRATIWEKLSGLTREHDCWTYVHPAQCTRDGHLRYISLKSHYLELIMLTTCQPKQKESLRWPTIAVKSAIGISKSMSSYTRISMQFLRDSLNMDMLVLMLG